jgi:hypothetical protein
MKDYPYPYPWKELSGTPEEKRFLETRFAEMSVRECYLLEGASLFQPIDNAADLINLTEQLDCFVFYCGATDDSALGEYIAKYRERVTCEQLPFFDLACWGKDAREQHGGVFVSGGFVEQVRPCRQCYDGTNINMMSCETSVQLKVASGSCPAGVWVKLPDHEPSTGEPDELAAAMGALGIKKWCQAVLLEAKCCLDNISDLSEQYGSLKELIEKGNDLGYVLEERGQGMACFEERFRAAMELESCIRLDEALDISENLDCYDFIPDESQWEHFGQELARRSKIIDPGSTAGIYFDYAAYCKAEIERLRLKPCTFGYIARNDHEFINMYSRAQLEPDLSI